MASKLTLSLNSKVIEEAKRYSEKKGTSLSKLIEDYLIRLTSPKLKKEKVSVKELRGILKTTAPDLDYKEIVREHLYEKHVKR